MYPILLFPRWSAGLCWVVYFAIIWAYRGWLGNKTFTKFDERMRWITATIAHIQLVIGVWLYFISPVVNYFLHNFKDAVGQQIRFFGMEHVTMMLTAIVIITIGSAKAKRKNTDGEKFKTMAIWFTIGLLIILTSVPWSFSPLVGRPNFRPFKTGKGESKYLIQQVSISVPTVSANLLACSRVCRTGGHRHFCCH